MKVGYVVKRYPLLSQTFIVNEILAHEAAGLDIEIFSLRPPRAEARHACVSHVTAPVTYVPEPDLDGAHLRRDLGAAAEIPACRGEAAADIHQALVLARLVLERGITHLHAHFANVATTVARLASRFVGVPYTFTAHARDIFHETVAAGTLARKLKAASAVITVSDFNARHLRAAYGTAARGVCRVYNGLDLSRFRYSPPAHRVGGPGMASHTPPPLGTGPGHRGRSSASLRGLAGPDCAPAVIAVGRLIEKKGFAVLLDACALLVQRSLRFRCPVVGAGPLDAALRAQVARLGLQGVVELVGPRPQEDVIRLVQRAAVLAAPCVVGHDGDRDGLPTVLIEAMALGTPCISTNVTGIPEIVRDGETGVVVPERDAPALAGAIERLLGDAALREKLAAAGRRLIEQEFDIRTNAAQLRTVFAAAQARARTR